MSIHDDTRRWLMLPAPRPAGEAPAWAIRYAREPRLILRGLAVVVAVSCAAAVAGTAREGLAALVAFGVTFGLPLVVTGEHLARRNLGRICGGPVVWWRVEAVRRCRISRDRADGAWRDPPGEAFVRGPRQGSFTGWEVRLIDPLSREIRYTCALPGLAGAAPVEVGEEVAVAEAPGGEAGQWVSVFYRDRHIGMPARCLGALPSGRVSYPGG